MIIQEGMFLAESFSSIRAVLTSLTLYPFFFFKKLFKLVKRNFTVTLA